MAFPLCALPTHRWYWETASCTEFYLVLTLLGWCSIQTSFLPSHLLFWAQLKNLLTAENCKGTWIMLSRNLITEKKPGLSIARYMAEKALILKCLAALSSYQHSLANFLSFTNCIIVGCGLRIKLAMSYSMLITHLPLSFFQKLIKLQSFISSHGMRGKDFLFQGRKKYFLMTKQFAQLEEHFDSCSATLSFFLSDYQIIRLLCFYD